MKLMISEMDTGILAVGVDDLEATHQAHKEAGYTVTDLSGLPGKPKNVLLYH